MSSLVNNHYGTVIYMSWASGWVIGPNNIIDIFVAVDYLLSKVPWQLKLEHAACHILYVIQMGQNKIETLTVRISLFFRESILHRASCIICNLNHLFNNIRNRSFLTLSSEEN